MGWNKAGNVKGATGSTGATGTGLQGPKGTDGPAGSQWHIGSGVPGNSVGAVGDFFLDSLSGHYYNKTTATNWHDSGTLKGAPGAGLTIKPSVAGNALPSLGLGDAGNAYIITTDGTTAGKAWVAGHLAVWDGTTWHDAGKIEGPPGPAGPAGPLSTTPGPTGGVGPAATLTAAPAALAVGAAPTVTAVAGKPGEYVIALPVGADGVAGAAGGAGPRGSRWRTGAGAPSSDPSDLPGDMYLNATTGDVYQLV